MDIYFVFNNCGHMGQMTVVECGHDICREIVVDHIYWCVVGKTMKYLLGLTQS